MFFYIVLLFSFRNVICLMWNKMFGIIVRISITCCTINIYIQYIFMWSALSALPSCIYMCMPVRVVAFIFIYTWSCLSLSYKYYWLQKYIIFTLYQQCTICSHITIICYILLITERYGDIMLTWRPSFYSTSKAHSSIVCNPCILYGSNVALLIDDAHIPSTTWMQ